MIQSKVWFDNQNLFLNAYLPIYFERENVKGGRERGRQEDLK